MNQRNESHHEKEQVKISNAAKFQSCRPNTHGMADIWKMHVKIRDKCRHSQVLKFFSLKGEDCLCSLWGINRSYLSCLWVSLDCDFQSSNPTFSFFCISSWKFNLQNTHIHEYDSRVKLATPQSALCCLIYVMIYTLSSTLFWSCESCLSATDDVVEFSSGTIKDKIVWSLKFILPYASLKASLRRLLYNPHKTNPQNSDILINDLLCNDPPPSSLFWLTT